MSAGMCVREPDVAEAVRRGAFGEDLRRHVAGCPACQQAETVASALIGLDAGDTPRLPDPRAIWLRARLEHRRRAARRVDAIVGTMHRVGIAATGVVGVVGGRWLWPKIEGAAAAVAETARAGGDPSALLVLVATAGVLALLLTWNRALTGDS